MVRAELTGRAALPRIKVCGVTNSTDVEVAMACGADAIGFVHHPGSPRHVSVDKAASLSRVVDGRALVVLVVVHSEPGEITAKLLACGADAVQLCGAAEPSQWRHAELLILRRLGVGPGAQGELQRWQGIADLFVLDHPHTPGGSGKTVDLALASDLAARAPSLLAGGLHAGNASQAIGRVRPWGVDASSLLESAPGRKNPSAVTAFVDVARRALQEIRR